MKKTNRDVKEVFLETIGEDRVLFEEPMERHTTFRAGGPAKYYLTPKRGQIADVLGVCRQYGIPYLIIGNGSNLLVSDRGYEGAVIEIGNGISKIRIEGETICAEAGALLSRTAHAALEAGLTGMEFAGGIPGCIGGAVVMNAGAYGGEMKDIIRNVTVLTEEGIEKKLYLEELDLAYRHSSIIENHYIVVEAELELKSGDPQKIRERMEELKKKRLEKQPLEYPSAGSTFKRPEGYFAGKLIMDAGLRGFQVGGAAVSEKHCGFVINREQATASDIYQLVLEVQEIVWQKFGVRLEPEVKMVGDFT